jgi:hypothetical protein
MVAGIIGLILAAPVTAIVIGLKKELTQVGFFDDGVTEPPVIAPSGTGPN